MACFTSHKDPFDTAQMQTAFSYTVQLHIKNMLEKTGYKNRIGLAVNAKTTVPFTHEMPGPITETENTFCGKEVTL